MRWMELSVSLILNIIGATQPILLISFKISLGYATSWAFLMLKPTYRIL